MTPEQAMAAEAGPMTDAENEPGRTDDEALDRMFGVGQWVRCDDGHPPGVHHRAYHDRDARPARGDPDPFTAAPFLTPGCGPWGGRAMSVEFPRDWSDQEVRARLVGYVRRGRTEDAERMASELVDRMATVAAENRRLRDD